MSYAPGTTLGNYRITSALGAGGMGEVWRATDEKLGREVALKVLPEEFAKDPDRMARFEREAKVLASLNHPNIATLFGLESASSGTETEKGTETVFLAMELVEGEDLSERIKRGAMPVEEANRHRTPDCGGARSGARERHRPPRSQTGQHQDHRRRRGQGARFRAGQGVGERDLELQSFVVADDDEARHSGGRGPRHRGLHVARPGARQTG